MRLLTEVVPSSGAPERPTQPVKVGETPDGMVEIYDPVEGCVKLVPRKQVKEEKEKRKLLME